MFALTFALAALFLLTGLGWAPLIDWDENIYAEVARQIVERGDPFHLWVNGQPFVEKPPLFMWEAALSFLLFGVNEAAARLPSALNGLLLMAMLAWMGRRLGGPRLAWLWPVMYGASLLPLIYTRTSVTDHTFNTYLTVGALALLGYDEAWRKGGRKADFGPVLGWMTLAAMAMGAAVLVKGPLGGVIPLVAFGSSRLAARDFKLCLPHALYVGALSLAIASAWYVGNYLEQGPVFVAGFSRFQGQLFSTPLDGHTGPVYYHVLVALGGLFPWVAAALVGLGKHQRAWLWAPDRRRLVGWALGWVVFVQVLFAMVQTKLPHYSASMYIPLSLLAALVLSRLEEEARPLPGWAAWFMGLYGAALGLGLAWLPFGLAALAVGQGYGLTPSPHTPWWGALPGLALAAGIALGAWRLARGRIRQGVAVAAVTMGLLGLGLWRVHLPLFAAYNQGPLLTMMARAYTAEGDLALYNHVSFAALFYGQRDIPMLNTYKFTADPQLLRKTPPRDLYVITRTPAEASLRDENPRLEKLDANGGFVLYKLPANK